MKLDYRFWIKAILITIVCLSMPFMAPAAIDLILLADLMGLEALLLFLIYQARHVFNIALIKLSEWRIHLACMLLLVGGLYCMEPHVVLAHLGASVIFLTATTSVLCALLFAWLLWIPPMLLSRSSVSPMTFSGTSSCTFTKSS
jgi:hypothetical protein